MSECKCTGVVVYRCDETCVSCDLKVSEVDSDLPDAVLEASIRLARTAIASGVTTFANENDFMAWARTIQTPEARRLLSTKVKRADETCRSCMSAFAASGGAYCPDCEDAA